ncbi:YwaF family protein [Williamsoniiplasma lucivorax]|uniref:Uncharacterized protein n=1 Tax=Williamsoniiplasma lucivorax TaxID=209274 RepID=A0A2S5REJ8_9MOLU|nr:YwaF family protein [Williamsoniiplasma lucivorax]PPE05746.1 hypothetical protein ELUCI_v1c00330 [Williamsoniiplasma lucivorax]
MNHIPEYITEIIISIIVMSSLFIFHKFWAKTAKTYWVRIVILIWMLAVQIWFYIDKDIFNPNADKFMYFELCNMVAWTSIILMIFPTKIQVDALLPLAIIGPTLTILIPLNKGFTFAEWEYYQFYFGHLGTLFGYFYIYLYGYTNSKLSWVSIKRSMCYAFIFLTFVMVWNMAYSRHNPLEPAPSGQGNLWWGPNYIYGLILFNIGLGSLSLLNQYFMMILVLGPAMMLIAYTILYFVRPLYAHCGTEKLKFNIHDDILGLKAFFTKENVKHKWLRIINKIKA